MACVVIATVSDVVGENPQFHATFSLCPMFGGRASQQKRSFHMRKYLLAGAAAFVIAAPAGAANDTSGYVGLEGAIRFPKSQDVSGEVVFTNTGPVDFTQTNLGSYRYKKGLDLD